MTEYPLNPGLPQTFPWLSQMADAYEEYRIKGMIFEYKSTSGEYVTTAAGVSSGALGAVVMATNYNAAIQPAFLDKKSMENYEHAQSSPPTRSMIHAIESKGSATVLKTMYLRTGPAPEGTDIRLYDLGNFCLATQGMMSEVDNATIGELWCAYEVEFFKPRYRPGGAKSDHFALRFDNATPASNNLVGGSTNLNPFGTAPRIDRLNPVRSGANPNNGVFAAGSYILNVAGVSSTIYLPKNPGAWYKVGIIVRSQDPLQDLRADGATPLWTFTPNATCQQVTGWVSDWRRSGAFAPSSTGGIGPSTCWTTSTIYQILPFDASTPPALQVSNVNVPDIGNPYTYDIIVEEVNPFYYTNPSR